MDTLLQAEAARFQGPQIASNHTGAQGTFVDYQNSTNDFIEWTFNAPQAGSYGLSWHYALGDKNRPLSFSLNGETVNQNLNFGSTGSWSNWNFVNQSVNLNAGLNTIRLTANGSSGANFDYLKISDNATPPIGSQPESILIFHGTTGFRHDSIDEGIALINEFGQDKGWRVTDTQDLNLLNPTNLAQYDAVIALNSIGTSDNPTQVSALTNYVRNGGALIGVHGGISTFGESNEFAALLGAKADTRNNRANLHSPNNTNVEISVNNHPANLGLPGSFAFADELYNFTTQPQAEYLFTVDESTYIGDNGVGGSNHPLAWVRNEGQGRVFYSALGHDEHLYEGNAPMDLLFQQHLEQGIEWALNAPVAPPIPSIIRINAGGGAYTDRNGNLWSADRHFTGGNVASTQAAIANTQDDPLYQSERWLRNLAYAVPVAANGDYQVTLKLADFWANAAGDRVFDVSAEGRKVLDDVDVFAQAGGKNIALDKTFNVTVSDGILNLDFLASANNAKLSALEIIPKALTNPPPTFSRLINFQATASATPQGYSADIGEAFNPTRGYGWITEASVGRTPVPVDLRGVARDRQDPNTDPRLNTFLHMEHIGNDAPAAAWEYALPNGDYSVTVSVGDRYFDSTHRINIEGQNILPNFVPTSRQPYELATATVRVNDGRLTLDSIGGDNTRLNYVEIKRVDPGDHPRIPSGVPLSRASNINRNAAITLDVDLLGTGSVVDGATLTNRTVQLYRTRDGAPVAGIANTTGGGDAIVFQPSQTLDANTHYTFRLSDGVKDESGVAFLPFSTTFSTGSGDNSNSAIRFNRATVYTGTAASVGFSSLEMSPDGTQLYGATITGELHRWTIATDGRLTNQQTFLGLANANRSIIGLVFDPQDPKTLWITNNDSVVTPPPANDFTSKISKVTLNSGSSFAPTVTDYVVGLPRATRSHMSNSLEFGPDGALYLTQGGNAATGAPDSNWGNRPERLLTASVLRIDPRRTAPMGGFNVQTETYNGKPGTYNPFAPNAPVTLYGKGIRNAYDLVWHSNGSLYVPNNGSGAAEGNTPDDPRTPFNEALLGVNTQNDYLYRVESGGYYGHPNPAQGHYILNGGNPTAGLDPAEVSQYAVGTQPDPLYRGFAYDFGRNRSTNGAIEYLGDAFGGKLRNQLLVTEYSAGDDILALKLGANGSVIGSTQIASGLNNPLDLVEHRPTGNLYVSEFGANQISLLSVV